MNSTSTHFILGAFLNVGNLKYFYVILIGFLYMLIIVANTSLTAVICTNRSLHEPMYLFLCGLFVNELYGSTGLFPFLLIQVVSDIHTVSAPLCFLQVFNLYTYANIEFCILAIMSYDRYLAICCPLQYNTSMTPNKVGAFLILTWIYCFVKTLITLSLSVNLLLCGNVMNSIYCSNYLIVRLACTENKVNNIYGIFTGVLSIFVPLLPITFSYIKILKICFASSNATRQKALNTCVPQLVSLLNFSFGCFFEILRTRFDMSSVPGELQVALSLYFAVIQPFLSPLMFGMQMSKLRNTYFYCCKMLVGHRASP